MKYWEKLLSEWRKKGKDGLTIPFIIGSQKLLTTNHHAQNTAELIIDIAQGKEFKIYIKYCLNTNDLILGIYDESKRKYFLENVKFKNNEDSNLYVFKFNNDLGENVETVAENLSEKYSGFIKLEQFSKSERNRGGFEPTEETFIQNCFNPSIEASGSPDTLDAD